MRLYFKLFFLCLPYLSFAQTYPDHFGTGQYSGLSVSSSDGIVNLALNKPSTQSSTFSSTHPSSNANDGRFDNINHTLNETNAWWEVDLQTITNITEIKIFNRTNCCGNRLDNFHVLVSDTPFISTELDATIDQPEVSNYSIGIAQDINTISINRNGRYVRIQLAGTNYLHMQEVEVLGSDDIGINSVNGTGILPDLAEASRFLSQATMGYNYEEIEYVSQIGIDAWLEEQFNIPITITYRQRYDEIYDTAISIFDSPDLRSNYFNYAAYDMIFKEPDVLRHKMAFTLSQIFVASMHDLRGDGCASYYDFLYTGAFGNFRDMLYNVSLSPLMGWYLSAYGNNKEDLGLGRQPDENYAREIMQLFSIGVYELNNDGTQKFDENGTALETYTNDDIKELAKVFTGLGARFTRGGSPASFQTISFLADMSGSMKVYKGRHDTNEKTMIDGTVLPAAQTGVEDINAAIDALFNHPNVGPFIGHQLIQQLVKSNPSPAYINRVANAFNNNGEGIRGDMEAVVRAVLTDPEARDCNVLNDPKAGKLIQPLERHTNLCLAFDVSTPSDRYWFKDNYRVNTIEQSFFRSPSVFNFFRPEYAETSVVAPNGMVSPEFQILNTTSGIHYLNETERSIKDRPFPNYTNAGSNWYSSSNSDRPVLDLSDEIQIFNTQGISALLDRLDILLCRGQLSANTRNIIENTITQYQANVSNYDTQDAVNDILYFIMASPDYVIRR